MTNRRHMFAAMVLALPLLTSSTALAQPVPCQPGFQAALAGPNGPAYQALFAALNPHTVELRNRLSMVMNGATYVNLLNLANTIANNNNARLVITLPDGTVVIDTNRNDGPANPQNNAYPNFVNKTINENHNSRAAILSAQLWNCGTAVETKTSTSTGDVEHYVAVRLGAHLDSEGTARLSKKQ